MLRKSLGRENTFTQVSGIYKKKFTNKSTYAIQTSVAQGSVVFFCRRKKSGCLFSVEKGRLLQRWLTIYQRFTLPLAQCYHCW